MAYDDDDEPPEGTVLGTLRDIGRYLVALNDRLCALEQCIGVPGPADDNER